MSVNQKGTALVGGAATDEALASSHSVLSPGSFGTGQKGLQQFYSPPELARLVRRVIGGRERLAVLDPTAGDGMLLSEFETTNRFGIEIDADQIKNSKEANRGYHALKGDLQHVYTLLRQGIPSWEAIVANPPFGLQWSDPSYRDGKNVNSTLLTWVYCSRLLAEDGQLIFVAGRDRFYRQIAELNEAASVYAVIECDDLFEGTTLPCVVTFAMHANMRSPGHEGYVTRKLPREMLDLGYDWVVEQRRNALNQYDTLADYTPSIWGRADNWEKIQKEYDRRLEGRVKANREYDAILVGGKAVQWLPSGFATLALNNNNDAQAFHGLNGQPIAYFAQNERLWAKLLSYAAQGIITLDPKLETAVDAIVSTIRRERVPLYRVKPTQRLGFLTDIEFLRCIKDTEDGRFKKGEMYRLDTRSKTVVEREKRVVESKKKPGEYVEKEFEKQKKALEVRVGSYAFLDGGEAASRNIKWLVDHFEMPDPGDVATRHPEDIAELEALIDSIMDEFEVNSRKWEAKNPSATPFSKRDFQIKDIARMVFKKGGLLSWEQGLGKTLGGLAFYRAAVKLGAQDALLIVTANDLIQQWTRECERFLGKTPELIAPRKSFTWERGEDGKLVKGKTFNTAHGVAKQLANHLRKGGTGIYIAHYGTLSIAGTIGQNLMMPVVTVREWTEPRKMKGTDKWGYFYWTDKDGNELKWEEVFPEAQAHMVERYRQQLGRDPDEYSLKNKRELEREAVKTGRFIQEPCETSITPSGNNACHGYIQYREYKITKKLTSRDLCPACEADLRNGWNGAYCEADRKDGSGKCGYSHYAVKVKPISSLLSTAFRRGVGIYDEIQMIQARAMGGDSKRSKALRGPQFGWFLGMTGTPIKNYIDQAFWPLWKSLGNGSTRFPYESLAGPIKFESDFAVIEYIRNGGRRENRKALPEVTNLSMLWRLLASSIIRRRKEETGEPLVPMFYNEIRVPLGLAQAEQLKAWLDKENGFPALFKDKYPEHPIVKAGMHEILAPTLGLNWKLDYVCTIPESDPDMKWTGVGGVSNFTPANLRVIELAMALVKQGRKVLIGSNMKATSAWISDRLNEKDIKAIHILDEDGDTVDADQRAKRVYSFQTDDVQVFCAGTKAIRLGHNLDAASAVILHGLDFDYEGLAQFIARIHRLTSKEPVDVFVILPTLQDQHTITTRKWDLLDMKGGAAELALDGRLILKNEQQISEAEMIRDLMERGFRVTSEAVDEQTVYEAWEAIPPLGTFEIREGVIPPRPTDHTATGGVHIEGARVAAAIGKFFVSGFAEKTPETPDGQLDLLNQPVIPDEMVLAQNADEFDAIEDELLATELAALEGLVADVTSETHSSSSEFIPFAGAHYNPELNPSLPDDDSVAEMCSTLDAFIKHALTPRSGVTAPETTAAASEGLLEASPVVDHGEPASGEAEEDAATLQATQAAAVVVEDDEPEDNATATAEEPAPPAVVLVSPLAQLKEAKELLDLGILDQDEFDDLKATLLAQVKAGVAA